MLLNYKKWLLLAGFFCFAFIANAQTAFDIAGFVCTRGTTVRVAQVKVMNKRTKNFIMTDDLGTFTIKAAIGDSIEFSKYDYTTATTPVANLTDMVIFLQQVTHLQEVKVQGQTKQQELNSVMNDYKKKGVYADGKPSALSAIASPLNGLYSLFGKEPKNARHFAAMAEKDLQASQDHRKYNKELVKKVTNLPDDEIQKFMDAYTPMHDDLMKWSDYDVINYIKRSLDSYKKYGAPPALPKLN